MSGMFREILPPYVAVAERGDVAVYEIFASEAAHVQAAVETRRLEFAGGRAAAHRALFELGAEIQPVGMDARGAPEWPPGVVGSITHCEGLRACAVAWEADASSIGIDAEPNEPLPPGLLSEIASVDEIGRIGAARRQRTEIFWDRMWFVLKEASYKAWYPHSAGAPLDFAALEVVVDPRSRLFAAQVGPGPSGSRITGRWVCKSGFIGAAVVCGADATPEEMNFDLMACPRQSRNSW